jgi:hypothetical protein
MLLIMGSVLVEIPPSWFFADLADEIPIFVLSLESVCDKVD